LTKKIGGATFWAIFSQAHPVTLLGDKTLGQLMRTLCPFIQSCEKLELIFIRELRQVNTLNARQCDQFSPIKPLLYWVIFELQARHNFWATLSRYKL
jgi:hypothetical protein